MEKPMTILATYKQLVEALKELEQTIQDRRVDERHLPKLESVVEQAFRILDRIKRRPN
jgi:hypothetical protein